MAVILNHVYLVGLMIPPVINEPSPMKAGHILGPLHTVDAAASTKALKNIRRHFCIILHYDATSKIGVLMLGTSRPQRPHRFVPCKGTERLPYQPRHEVSLSPSGALRSTGYFNFSHAVRASIFLPGDTVLTACIPPQAFLTEKYGDGTNIDVFLDPLEVDSLKNLHTLYWEGVRYDSDGSPMYPGGGGSGGGTGGGDRSSGGSNGRTGEEDDANPERSTSGFRPLRADGTILLAISPSSAEGSGAERLARALIEEDERVAQLELVEGDHAALPAPSVYAFLQPLTISALDLVDPF